MIFIVLIIDKRVDGIDNLHSPPQTEGRKQIWN